MLSKQLECERHNRNALGSSGKSRPTISGMPEHGERQSRKVVEIEPNGSGDNSVNLRVAWA